MSPTPHVSDPGTRWTVAGLDSLPPDADGHFSRLPPELAQAAVTELTAKLEALRA